MAPATDPKKATIRCLGVCSTDPLKTAPTVVRAGRDLGGIAGPCPPRAPETRAVTLPRMTSNVPNDLEEAYGRILKTLVEAARSDHSILAIARGGSAVVDALDEYSDLDLLVVCRDDAHSDVLAHGHELAASLGPLLASFTGDHIGEPRLLICLYGPPLCHVDLKFIRLSDIGERVEEPILVWRRDELTNEALRVGAARWPIPDPQWIEDRFWVWVHYCATKIGRGELYECIDALNMMRSIVLGPLLAVRHGRRPQGVRRLEQYAPESARLERTVANHTVMGCIAALHATVDLYRDLREDHRSGLVTRDAGEAASSIYLDELEARLANAG